jgi:hypothetical protein
MVVGRVLRTTGCDSCRLSLLRSFTSVSGLPNRSAPISARLSVCSNSRQQTRRSSNVPESHQGDLHIKESEVVDEGIEEELETQGKALDAHQVSAVPWYLQIDTPQRAPQPLSERQRIPDLPEAPPPILQPLLQHISIDLGLDDLNILDLRKLDPPPALGANLLMLLGTARSEKHLHVSADRLCRWLRSTYKLRPDADGLLGRNELKLKLRRKSRRAKLLSSASDDNGDDGVRTGWVCVDVGVVGGGESESAPAPESKFVGFGRRSDGVRIVVQMLTEEKREEIDLEKLWEGILKRAGKPEVEDENTHASTKLSNTIEQDIPEGHIPGSRNGLSHRPSSILTQSRGFHTTARRVMEPEVASTETASSKVMFPITNTLPKLSLDEIKFYIMHAIKGGDYEKAKADALQHVEDVFELQNGGWRTLLLEQTKLHLESLPTDLALEHLGTGFSDYSSTPFLTFFYQCISPFPSQAEAEARLWLHCFAREIGHYGYKLYGLLALFSEVQLSGVKISATTYHRLLYSILCPTKATGSYHGPPRHAVEGAMKVIQTMHDQGIEILHEDVFVILQEATFTTAALDAPPGSLYVSPEETFDFPSFPMSPIQRRIHVLMKAIDLPPFREESRLRLLDLYARQCYWRAFWDVWRMAPRQRVPQSAALYTLMFNAVARTKNQRACMTVLRTWVPEMDREEPAVRLDGDLAVAIIECIKVADPYVATQFNEELEVNGEWMSLYRRCVASV